MDADLIGDTVRARAVRSHGARYMQQRVGKIEQASELVRSFTPTIVDGLPQTPDYVRAMGAPTAWPVRNWSTSWRLATAPTCALV